MSGELNTRLDYDTIYSCSQLVSHSLLNTVDVELTNLRWYSLVFDNEAQNIIRAWNFKEETTDSILDFVQNVVFICGKFVLNRCMNNLRAVSKSLVDF